MAEKMIERRLCLRFKVPGATINYVKIGLFGKRKSSVEEFCPMLDMSRGGVRFLTQKLLSFRSKVAVEIFIPAERQPLTFTGRVIWAGFNPGKSYKYQVGIKFDVYGEEKKQNNPANLTRIIGFEQRFLEPGGPLGAENQA